MIFKSAGELSTAGGADELPPHAVRTKTAMRTNSDGRMNMRIRLLLLNLDFGAHCWWPPFDQAVFKRGDDCFRYQRHGGKQEHPRENSVGVEVVLGAVDQLSHAFGRPKELADHSTDQRQAEADMEAGDELALDLAHALERVEEHDEEDEDRRGRDLGTDVEPQ